LSVDELVDKLNNQPISIKTVTPLKLDLSKRIGLNFEKLNLNKPEVLENIIFLLDISGSMDSIVDDKSKIDHLTDVMLKYPDAKMICFSSKVEMIDNIKNIPRPAGSTNLALALKYIKSKEDNTIERVVLVSDGEPDDKNEAFKASEKLNLPIDIIFIGKMGTDAEIFMEQLSKQTGGQHFTV
jgi:hypothetical protein